MAARKPQARKRKPRVEVYEKWGGLRHFVLKLKSSDQYAVLAAVRGPDRYSETSGQLFALKNRVTERIRGIVFVGDCPGDYRTDPMDAQCAEDVIKNAANVIGAPGARHYLSHLRIAIKATQGHKIWGGNGPRLVDGLTSMGAV